MAAVIRCGTCGGSGIMSVNRGLLRVEDALGAGCRVQGAGCHVPPDTHVAAAVVAWGLRAASRLCGMPSYLDVDRCTLPGTHGLYS